MTSSKDIFGFNDKWLVIIGIPFVSLLTSAMMFGDVLINNNHLFFTTCFTASLIYTTIYWLIFRQVVLFFGRKFPKPKDLARRIAWQAAVVLIIFFALQSILDPIIHGWLEKAIDNPLQHEIQMTISSLLITFFVLTIYLSGGIYSQLQKSLLEKERLIKENVQSQLESLKNQVNPHFFFNSLNTLAWLIPENPEKAVNFVQKLSKAYRYILEIREKEVVTLAEELDFLDSYTCLLKERFGENLLIEVRVQDELLQQKIIPLSLQMLFENAIKHNVVSTQNPLHIEVSAENGDRLVVKNNLQKKKQENDSTKIGLENIRSRYRLVSDKSVEVIATQQSFIVILPLLDIESGGER